MLTELLSYTVLQCMYVNCIGVSTKQVSVQISVISFTWQGSHHKNITNKTQQSPKKRQVKWCEESRATMGNNLYKLYPLSPNN